MARTLWSIIVLVIAFLLIFGLYYFGYFGGNWQQTNTAPNSQTNSATPPPAEEWKVYVNPDRAFSIQYRADFSIDESYQYENFSSGKKIPGVSFTVPKSLAEGTNLADDTRVSVEFLEGARTCSALSFLETVDSRETVREAGAAYDVAKRRGAAAGNLYEEIVYLLQDCYAIRYFLHSGNIGNYEPGAVREFDRNSLLQIFDRMRRSYQYYSKG